MLRLPVASAETLFLTVIMAELRLQETLIRKAETFSRQGESCGRMGREVGCWGSTKALGVRRDGNLHTERVVVTTPPDFCNDIPGTCYGLRSAVLAVNTKSLDEYFQRLSECITRNHIDPDDVWNLGFMIGCESKKND